MTHLNPYTTIFPSDDGRYFVETSWEEKRYGPFPLAMATAFSEASLKSQWREIGYAC